MKHHRDYEDRFSGPGIMPDHFGTNDWEDLDITGEDPRARRDISPPSPVWSVGVKALAAAAVIILAALLFWPAEGRAHQAPTGWQYPFMCCSDRDCTMLPKGAVKETPLGFVVTVLPGQHDFVKDRPVQFLIPYGEEKLSPDGEEHICITPQLKVLCFFTGSRGF